MKINISILAAVALAGVVSACASVGISDISTDKVAVDTNIDNLQLATGEADRGCSLYRRHPVFLSKRIVPTGGYTQKYVYLFACMAPGHANVQIDRQ